MSRIKAYRLKVPVGSKIELWTSGKDYRTDASVEHGPRGGASQEIVFGNTNLERPETPDAATPPPDSFQAQADRFYSILFTTQFRKATAGKVRIQVVITHPNGSQPAEGPAVFDLQGTSADRPEVRIVTFETKKN